MTHIGVNGVVVAGVFLLGCVFAMSVPEDIIAVNSLPVSSSEKLTPDYIAGPWFPMDPETAFAAWTKRPQIAEAVTRLSNASSTIQQIDQLLADSRKTRNETEQNLITYSQGTIEQLKNDIDHLADVAREFEKIQPAQGRIRFETNEVLTPLLKEISGLFNVDAQIRFPFAERLAVYTEDLQKTLRAKEDAECKLKPFLPPDELQDTLHKYDEVVAEVKGKIDSEVKAAGDILNPNSKRLSDITKRITDSERTIAETREELKHAFEIGQSHISHEGDVKSALLENQQALLDSVIKAVEIEHNLEAKLKEFHDKEDDVIYHMASLLTALLQPNDQPAQSAFEQVIAEQSIKKD